MLKTSDGITIAGNHYKIPLESPGISLFHMMPATKESYGDFAKKLNDAGLGALAIDLRGHANSEGGPNGFNEFSDEQHQESIKDVIAAVEFQKNEGHSPLFICGASIGANLTLKYLAENDDVKKAILLSPGINYKGIESFPLAEKVSSDKEVYIVSAKDDIRELGPANEQGKKIFDALNCKKEIEVFDVGGHGTDIFKVHPEIMEKLIIWLKR